MLAAAATNPDYIGSRGGPLSVDTFPDEVLRRSPDNQAPMLPALFSEPTVLVRQLKRYRRKRVLEDWDLRGEI